MLKEIAPRDQDPEIVLSYNNYGKEVFIEAFSLDYKLETFNTIFEREERDNVIIIS
jgi:hypothetical protein